MDQRRIEKSPQLESPPKIVALGAINGFPAGGKAAGLDHLIGLGLNVPPGFVILRAERTLDDRESLAQAYDALGRGRVAVRSSALGEDGTQSSFAGQYETILEVEGVDALSEAVTRCVRSTSNERATSYRESRGLGSTTMNVVVQKMVDPRVAGVLFSADPVTGDRRSVIVDAVPGLGESLVSGQQTPDHYRLSRKGETLEATLREEEPLLSPAQLRQLTKEALEAEHHFDAPLDLEWAIDDTGKLHWLQARPITALPRDPDELGTYQDVTDHYTSCNVGECMPGAVTPLSWSTVWRGNDFSIQRMHQRIGAQTEPNQGYRKSRLYYGRVLLNLTKIGATSTHVAGASNEALALAICGRDVPDLDPGPPKLKLIRGLNGVRYLRYLMSGVEHEALLDELCKSLTIPKQSSARAMHALIDRKLDALMSGFDHHMTSSAGAGALEPALMQVLARGQRPTAEQHALVAALLAEASEHDVESADIVSGIDRIINALSHSPDGGAPLLEGSPEEALSWLRSDDAGDANWLFERYLERHGHRSVREFELREREWRQNPLPLVESLRAALTARRAGVERRRSTESKAIEDVPAHIRWLVRLTQRAVRRRERTKSLLVKIVAEFKVAYRHLGELCRAEGLLPDADAIFFLTHEELGALVRGESPELAQTALERRELYAFQNEVSLPDIFRGHPTPQRAPVPDSASGQELKGMPVSRGRVEGVARVARTVAEAAELRAGEILIAPITDVGWSPYFNIIAGLATDVGSSVSHGAVVAREHNLPAVVNLRFATQLFKTGDYVVLDGDRGTLQLIESSRNRENDH